MKNPTPYTRNRVPKMNAAARVAAWRTSRGGTDQKVYRPNPRRTLSNGSSWRQRPL